MNLDLSLAELELLDDALSAYEQSPLPTKERLHQGIKEAITDLRELLDADFDDCAGGACKL